jgi:hypothetical protein
MTIRCIQRPPAWAVAHVCDHPGCTNHSPMAGCLPAPLDSVELDKVNLACPRNGICDGAKAGFHIGKTPEEPDFCPEHKPR